MRGKGPQLLPLYCRKTAYHIFRTIRRTPQIWEEHRGAPYSPNEAYIYIGEVLCYLCY